MKNILIGLAVVGVGGAIALGVRTEFPTRAPETTAVAADAAGRPVAVEPEAGIPVDAPAAAEAQPETGSAPTVSEAVHPATPPAGSKPAARAADTDQATTPRPSTETAATNTAQQEVPQEVGAEAVLLRASAAYEKVRSLQAAFVQRVENPLLRTKTTSRGTLYQRRPDRFLMKFTEPEGDLILSDGQYFWIYYPSVDRRQVIRSPAAAGGAGGVDLQAQFLGDPIRRFASTLEGKDTVQGRGAYVLTLVPREPVGYRKLKVWVDERDYLVRRFELTEESGKVQEFELHDLRINGTLADDLFRFTPPPDAHIVDRG